MTSVISDAKSDASRDILENLTKKSDTNKLYQMEAKITESMLTSAWTGFGLYIHKNIRAGKATTIPKFGIVTFGAPSVKLDGVTNPDQRDLRLRVPVFLINKEFVKGINIQTGIISGGNIRPFSMKGVISGLGQAKVNYTEIGFNAGLEKDVAKICVERVIKELAEKAKAGKNIEMDIPHIGKFVLRIPLAAMEFDEFLINESLDATNKVMKEKRLKDDGTSLSKFNVNEFIFQSHSRPNHNLKTKIVDTTGQNWLKNNFDIDVNTLSSMPDAIKSWKQAYHHGTRSETNTVYSRPMSAFSTLSSTSRISKVVNQTSQEKILFVAFQNAKKKVKKWINTNAFLPEDLYAEIVTNAFGFSKGLPPKLSYAEFKKGISKITGLTLEEFEIEGLAKALDLDNQEFINAEKWLKVFGNGRSYLNYIQDIVSNYNLQADDVLRRMGLTKHTDALDFVAVKEKLRFLDPSLKDAKAEKVAKELMKGKEKLEIVELIKLLGCEADNSRKEKEWHRKQLLLIKRKVGDSNKLRQHFEKYDEKSQGLMDIPTFKTALAEFNVGMTQDELTVFTRLVEKDTDMKIDYVNFASIIDKLKSEEELQTLSTTKAFVEIEQFNLISEKLQAYLKTNKLAAKDLVKKLSTTQNGVSKVLVENFAEFLHQSFRDTFIKNKCCQSFAKKVDIDRDGYINETDLETFLIRSAYIKEGERELKNSRPEANSATYNKLFPKAPLAEDKFEIVLRDLRNILNRKRISFYDLFNSIDQKQTGFITINDFNVGIDKVLKLSQPIKDGFFAYMDTEKLGIINYDDFLKVMQRSVADKRVDVTEDSFDWQSTMLQRIREYALEKELSADDAFRILDADFDGVMSRADLVRFLKEVFNVPADQATQPRVERLYKLMDVYKRGTVQLSDIKMLLQSSTNKNNLILSGGNNSSDKSSFDWRLHARQQIGLVLSKQYPNLEASFKEISENNTNMKYTLFKKWIEKNRVLTGFDLTDRLIQKLFADLDPHKKGYLIEADWLNAFAGYNTKNQILSEVQEALSMNFSDITNAYDFFASQGMTNKNGKHDKQEKLVSKEITRAQFEKAIHAILPKRFGTSEMTYLWRKSSNDLDAINFKRFMEVFGQLKFSGTSYAVLARTIQSQTFLSLSKPQTVAALFTGKTAAATIQKISKEEKQKKVFEKLRQILLASNIPIEKFFSKIDTDRSGEISNLEFINAIKGLNLGLNLQEIEDLLMYCDSNQDGKISFQEFIRKFAPQVVENRLFDRSKGRLKKFKENIYFYMLSPKDAFLKFNEDRTGRLTYEQFKTLVTRLSELAKEEVPPFPIIRDLFDFLDIRKDGIIDMTEWMQSFRLIETDPSATGDNKMPELPKRSATVDVRSLTKTYFAGSQDPNKPSPHTPISPTTHLDVSSWECSKEYEQILKLIGKNRKMLISFFEDYKKRRLLINAARVKEVIGQLLHNAGLAITDSQWLYLYKFAERDEVIDYKFMLDAFKERLYLLSAHPKTSVANV